MIVITLLLLMLSLALPGFAQAPSGPIVGSPAQSQPASHPGNTNATPPVALETTPPPPVSDDSTIVVPRDTLIPIVLTTTINTKSDFVGQAIFGRSIYPITVGNRIIIPEGSAIRGTVTEVVRPGRFKGRAKLGLRFDELVLPNGTTRQLRASLAGFGSPGNERFNPQEGQIEGSRAKKNPGEKVEQTTEAGSEIGSIVGWGDNHPIEGVALGTAAGAAAGVIWFMATRASDIVLPPGVSLTLKLSQPVTFARAEVPTPERQEPPPHSPYDGGPALPRRD
jgi:hypothetical protein